ncbi:MAG: ATP-binding protein [Bacteroidales bacterium]|nr:ATP-binding protein [Bacteroidales bacterium]
MKTLLKDIIADQVHFLSGRKNIIHRDFPEHYFYNEHIIIISGIRRCGKSILLQQIRNRLPQKDYFFNFDDDRLSGFSVENFQDLYEVFIELFGSQDYFYFDEIQNIAGWEQFVKRLYNLGKKVFITGSNARMLSKELGTLLTGCYLAVELYPFSFKEFLQFKGKGSLLEQADGTQAKGEIQAQFNTYLHQGGFPLYLSTKDDLVLKTLYDNILYRDILVRNQILNEKEIKELVYYAVSNIGKPFTYSSVSKIIGVKNPTTVKNYIEFIENTYLLFALNKLDYSVKVQLRNPKKMYAIDNALVKRLGFHFSGEKGRLLENLVYIELKRRGGEIFYHHSGNNECDFVMRKGYQVEQAIQVCYLFDNLPTREREISGLADAMKSYQLTEGYIITSSHEELVENEFGNIHIMPAWRWILS